MADAALGDFVARYEGFATETFAVMGARLQELNDTVTNLATKAVEQRVAAHVQQHQPGADGGGQHIGVGQSAVGRLEEIGEHEQRERHKSRKREG